MIEILIVEDNPKKSDKVIQVIQENTKQSSCRLTVTRNIKDAKEMMYDNTYDVVILDLVLPEDEEDKLPKAENGIGFLDDIYDNPLINEPSHVIGLTAVKELKPQYEEKFHKHKNHLIDYQEESFNWKDQLKNFIWRHLEEISKKNPGSLEYDYDIALITALDKELEAIKQLPVTWKKVESLDHDKTNYIETTFLSDKKSLRVVAAACPQMGMNAAAVLSMKLIQNFRPKYIIMTGIMASTKDKETGEFGFGDIIVADECWDGGAGKVTENENGQNVFQAGARHLTLNTDLKEMIRAYQENTTIFNGIRENFLPRQKAVLELHIGPTASVAGVIENSAIIKQLKSHDRKLLGLEMETYGVFYAANNCANPKPIPLSIKSISDFADTAKNDEYQRYAAYTSANFMYLFALNEL